MSKQTFKNSICCEKAAVFLEAAIVLPLLLFVFFSSYEFSHVMERYHNMATITREVANAARRSCSFATDKQSCLDKVISKYESLIDQNLPDAEVFVSMFIYDDITQLVTRSAFSKKADKHVHTSAYKAQPQLLTDFQNDNKVSSIGADNPIVVISEVFEPNNKKITPVGLIVGSPVLYDTAIF